MDLARLKVLKKKLQKDKDLGPVWLYFLDHFGDKSEFLELGENTEHAVLEAVLTQIAGAVYAQDGVLSRLVLRHVAEARFIHGSFTIGTTRIGGVFFFEDSHIGLAAVTPLPGRGNDSKCFRFSAQTAPAPGKPSMN